MNDEPERTYIFKLGDTRLLIEPDEAGGYVLRNAEGTVNQVIALVNLDDVEQFVRQLLSWAQEVRTRT